MPVIVHKISSGHHLFEEAKKEVARMRPEPSERVFCPGGARPPTQAMIAFIDDQRGAYGVEPICRVLPIAPST
jgi:hypothetical protein